MRFDLIRNHKIRVSIFLLFLLNLILGLVFINEGIFHFDGIVLARAVEDTYRSGHLHQAVQGRYGYAIITSIIYLPFFLLGKNADLAVRFTSVLFHALSIAAFFLFIYELFKDFIQATFGSLLLSVTPFYFSPNTYGKEHGASIFFLLLSFYLLCRGINRGTAPLICLSSFLIAFAISVRESLLAVMPLYFLLYLKPQISIRPFKISVPKEKLEPKPLLCAIAPFLIIFLFLFFSYLDDIIYHALFAKEDSSVTFCGLFSPIFKVAIKDLYKGIPMLVFIFFIFGLGRLYCNHKKNIFLPLFLLSWSMLIFYFGNVAVYAPRYLDIVIIPVYISASYILSELYAKDRLITTAIAIYLVLSMFIFMYPMLIFRHHYNGVKQFALFIKENTPDNALVISMDDAQFIEYYGQRKVLNHPEADRMKMHEFLRRVAVTLVNGVPVYLTGSGLSYDKKGVFRGILLTNFDIKEVGSKLCEDYHRPELEFNKYDHTLFKLDFKFK